MTSFTDFEAAWNALPQPAFIIDADNCFGVVNGAAEVFFSRSAASLAGAPVERMLGQGSVLLDMVEQARRGGVSLVQHDVELEWAEGRLREVTLHAAPLHDAPDAVLMMLQPRSFAEKMDRSLSHRSAARSVIGMAAMLAHEIKNPLAGISGAAQLLEMNLPDEDQELARLIRQETARIAQLLDRVEQFGDNRPAAREPVNIHDVLDRAKRSAKAGFAAHVRFIEDYDPSLPPTAGDSAQLIQVFLNLIKNAAEAAPQVGGVVAITTSFQPGMKLAMPGGRRESLPLQITVSDNGPGVPADLKKDIFEPFVTSKSSGSGLGLSLVSKIVADHGGVIECDSSPGWTTFRLLLPVWREKSGRAGAATKGRRAA